MVGHGAFPFLDLALCVGGQQQVAIAALDPFALAQQRLPPAMDARVRIVNAVGAVHAREDRLQRVVVGLRDRVELVVVTAGALDGGAGEGLHHRRDHVVAVEVAADLSVDGVLANVAQRTLIPRAGGNEAQGHGCLRVVRIKHIPGDLLLHESSIGLVGVEGGDEIIAVGPGVRADAVLVVTVRFREMGCVHPMARPALAVTGRGQ